MSFFSQLMQTPPEPATAGVPTPATPQANIVGQMRRVAQDLAAAADTDGDGIRSVQTGMIFVAAGDNGFAAASMGEDYIALWNTHLSISAIRGVVICSGQRYVIEAGKGWTVPEHVLSQLSQSLAAKRGFEQAATVIHTPGPGADPVMPAPSDAFQQIVATGLGQQGTTDRMRKSMETVAAMMSPDKLNQMIAGLSGQLAAATASPTPGFSMPELTPPDGSKPFSTPSLPAPTAPVVAGAAVPSVQGEGTGDAKDPAATGEELEGQEALLKAVADLRAEIAAEKAEADCNPQPMTGVLSDKQEVLLSEALSDLEALVGLDNIKDQITRQVARVKMDLLRKKAGLDVPSQSNHTLFLGAPGTGKTTVARIMGKIYLALGVLKKGHVIETNREGMVAGFSGQTPAKTSSTVAKAIGGVLFIDEAYLLNGTEAGSVDTFGKECIGILLQHMENYRDLFIVIMAGYTDPMMKMIAVNEGVRSRVSNHVTFNNYTAPELTEIYCRMAASSDYKVSDKPRAYVNRISEAMIATADKAFGNAREIRNLFERTMEAQALRVTATDAAKDGNVDIDTLTQITVADLEVANKDLVGYDARKHVMDAVGAVDAQAHEVEAPASEAAPAKVDKAPVEAGS